MKGIYSIMKCYYIESLYTKYKDQIIITKKSFDEWIATVNKNFPIKKVEITDSIINTFQLIENSTFDLNDWTIYLLEEETNTKIYYDFNRQRFVGNSPIYIFISNKKNRISTNCQLLQYKINILRGITTEDIVNKTADYKNYLNELYLYDWLINDLGNCETSSQSRLKLR